MKHFFKKLGRFVLIFLTHLFGVIPVFYFLILLIILISLKIPTKGIGIIPFFITSSIIFIGLQILIYYARKKQLWKNGYFLLFFIGIPGMISFTFDITYLPIVQTIKYELEERVSTNLGISDLKDIYRVPEEENSAHLEKLFKQIPKDKKEKANKLMKYFDDTKYTQLAPDTITNIEEILSPYTSLLDSFSNYKYFQYVWSGDYADSPEKIPIPNLVAIVRIGKAGIICARYDIEEKEYKSASIKLRKVWHLRNLIGYDPNLINSMVANVNGTILIKFLENGIKEGWALNSEFSSLIDEIYYTSEKFDPLLPSKPEMIDDKIKRISSINQELFFIKNFIERISSVLYYPYHTKIKYLPEHITKYDIETKLIFIFADIKPFVCFNYGRMLALIDAIVPKQFKSWQEYLDYYCYNNGKKIINKNVIKIITKPIPCALLKEMLPNLLKVIKREVDHLTEVRILKSAIEIEKIKKKIGKYPENFDEILIDPFNGEKLIYELKDKGYMIYSVGNNQKDDGGKKDDIVFEK